MAAQFAFTTDVETLWRPLSDLEREQVDYLLAIASAQLRQRLRNIDDRIALHASTPSDPAGLDPLLVTNAVVGAVRRFLNNPDGALNRTVSAGPYSQSVGYGERTGSQMVPRGTLLITDDDLRPLLVTSAGFRQGPIHMSPGRWAEC